VTPAEDYTEELESFLLEGVDPHGVTVTSTKKPFRLFTGTWAVELNPDLYQSGRQYVIHWRHAMQPKVLAVQRTNFVWQPIPKEPRSDGCVMYGTVTRNRVPVADAHLVVEEYRDYLTLTRRLSQIDISTDAFGNWWVEVPRNSIQRFVFNEESVAVFVPDDSCASLSSARRWTALDVPKDAYGYPIPGGVAKPPDSLAGGGTGGRPGDGGLSNLNNDNLRGIENCGLPTPGLSDVPPPLDGDGDGEENTNANCCRYEHPQATPATVWSITHNLNGHPSVTVVDTGGDTVLGDVKYTSLNTLTVTFLVPVAGYAYLD
jgi:hypothetical protein